MITYENVEFFNTENKVFEMLLNSVVFPVFIAVMSLLLKKSTSSELKSLVMKRYVAYFCAY